MSAHIAFGDDRCVCGCGAGIHFVAGMSGKKCCDACTGDFRPEYHENLAAGSILRDEHGTRIRVQRMRGTFASCERIKRDGTRDRRANGWSGSLCKALWTIEEEHP